GLAKRYQTTVKQLRQLNQLKSDNLPLGKRLRLPTSSTRS
ncbi:MAG TPA: LysM peptidoglycan-binding domain-containing protein, partial [Burkholderiaceae bacterium]|nr:LysM peptidoglycan-binding domain-containing protein [Burkholderiaceae bacterium]